MQTGKLHSEQVKVCSNITASNYQGGDDGLSPSRRIPFSMSFITATDLKMSVKWNQTAWWCPPARWGQRDDCCVVTTARQGQAPALELTITKISIVVSLTHKRTQTDIGRGFWPFDPLITFPDVYLLIPPILNAIHHHCQGGGGVCVCVWVCEHSMVSAERCAVCQYLALLQ